jgi:hypothetical protein
LDDEPYEEEEEEEESKSGPEEDKILRGNTKNTEKLNLTPIVPVAIARPMLQKHTSVVVNHRQQSSKKNFMSSLDSESPFGDSTSNLKLPRTVISSKSETSTGLRSEEIKLELL